VSTAYSHCHEKVIKEQFYPTPANADEMITLVECMVDKVEKPLNKVIKDIIHPWPNTYAFSKALTEEIVRRYGEYLPIAVVRPSIVVSTRADPFPGWSDNIYGLNGVIAGVALGIIRTMVVNSDGVGDIIPADMVINTIFAAGYETYQNTQVEVKAMRANRFIRIPPAKIFNCVTSPEMPITWSKYIALH
jgi:alcohol-forming fatty acyl-CoA reductase